VLSIAIPAAFAADGARLLSVDHSVRVKFTAPAIAGQDALSSLVCRVGIGLKKKLNKIKYLYRDSRAYRCATRYQLANK
jgi:hypothetical protein